MAAAAVIGLNGGKRLLSTSFYPQDLSEKLIAAPDHKSVQFSASISKNAIVARKSSHFSSNTSSSRQTQAIKALKEHVCTSISDIDDWSHRSDLLQDGDSDLESSSEVLLLLQKSMQRLLSTSFYPQDVSEKLFAIPDQGSVQFSASTAKNTIVAQKSSHFGSNTSLSRKIQAIKAHEEHVHTSSISATDDVAHRSDPLRDGYSDLESSIDAQLLLQKSMLEKQWKLPFDQFKVARSPDEIAREAEVTRLGISARQRRTNSRRRFLAVPLNGGKWMRSTNITRLLQASNGGYVRGTASEDLLTHAEVVRLSKKIKAGILLEEHRSKLKKRLGTEPCDKQLAYSLRMPCAKLHSILFECSLAREKLAMSNVRLVMSIAQKYDNLGVDMADLVQGGLIGLLRGIEKFDSCRGFRISTYIYWWIRRGVSQALVGNSRTLRLPTHLHVRLSSIRNAKIRLEEKGIKPSIDKLAESLNMSQKKVRNATEAVNKVISLDREAFPSFNGLSGDTLHSYIADRNPANNPWHGFEEWSVKDEVNKLLHSELSKRERDIIRLYHGLDSECRTWEDIGKQFGLSRERVRQLGLIAMEKLKHTATKQRLEVMLLKHE